MKCPKCKGDMKSLCGQIETQNNENYRCKKCLNCGHIIYTVEFEVEVTPQFKREWMQHTNKWYNQK